MWIDLTFDKQQKRFVSCCDFIWFWDLSKLEAILCDDVACILVSPSARQDKNRIGPDSKQKDNLIDRCGCWWLFLSEFWQFLSELYWGSDRHWKDQSPMWICADRTRTTLLADRPIRRPRTGHGKIWNSAANWLIWAGRDCWISPAYLCVASFVCAVLLENRISGEL